MKFIRVVNTINNWTGRLVSFIVLPLILIILLEVIMRRVFDNPTAWVHETSGFLLAAFTVLGGGYALLNRTHVNMEILYVRFPPRVRAILDLVTALAFFAFCIALVWKGGTYGWESLMRGETSGTAWNPPIGMVRMLIPVGAFLLLIQGIAHFIKDFTFAVTGKGET